MLEYNAMEEEQSEAFMDQLDIEFMKAGLFIVCSLYFDFVD